MELGGWLSASPYLAIMIAAAVEGEVVFVAAAALVASGQLNPGLVCAAGALGAAVGDQAYFFAVRRHIATVLDRLPGARHRDALRARIRRHEALAVITIRFAPGLRILLTVLCAEAGVSGRRFSLLNLVSAVVWAIGLMGLVGYAGPHLLDRLGLPPWISTVAPAIVLLVFVGTVAFIVRRDMARD